MGTRARSSGRSLRDLPIVPFLSTSARQRITPVWKSTSSYVSWMIEPIRLPVASATASRYASLSQRVRAAAVSAVSWSARAASRVRVYRSQDVTGRLGFFCLSLFTPASGSSASQRLRGSSAHQRAIAGGSIASIQTRSTGVSVLTPRNSSGGVEAPGRVLQGRENVLALELWVVGEDLLVRFARREEL
jgi:hypothetical protein